MVIMIDDDKDTLDIYRLLVERTNHSPFFLTFDRVTTALNYLQQYEEQPDKFPGYIFLDLSMPNQSGIDFIRAFESAYAARYPDTAIMVLTSSVRDSEHQEALSFQSVAKVISKPLPKQLLIDLLVASTVR